MLRLRIGLMDRVFALMDCIHRWPYLILWYDFPSMKVSMLMFSSIFRIRISEA